MKLVIAIVQDYDTDRFLQALSQAGIGATRIASTGGFLRAGNTTVFMGVDDGQVPECVNLARAVCQARVQRVPMEFAADIGDVDVGAISEVTIGGAVVFVMTVSQFVRVEAAQPNEVVS